LPARHRVHVLADQQQEAVAAVEVTAVEADVGRERVSFNRLHDAPSS